MKKLLLTGAMLVAFSFASKAQSLYSESYNALTVGDVGTDLTGTTPGQGNILTYVANNGANSDFQIIAEGQNGNGLQISAGDIASGTTTATSNVRYAWADGLGDAWASRDTDNDVITAEYYFNSAVVDGSTSLHRAVIYSEDGFIMGGYQYNASTGVLTGLLYYSNAGQTGTYSITLVPNGLIIPQNQWLRLGIAIDPASGTVIWASPDIMVQDANGNDVAFSGSLTSSVAAGLVPAEFDFVSVPGASNTATSYAKYDGLAIKATTADLPEFLGTKTPTVKNLVGIYPNPSSDVVNVIGAGLVNNISVTDLNGRVVKSVKFAGVENPQINIADLASGVYVISIASDKGTTTDKIVKN